MNKSRIAMIGLLVAAIPSAQAWAEDGDGTTGMYGYASFGAFNGPNQVGSLQDASDGFVMNAGLGHRFSRYFAGELELSIAGQTFDSGGFAGEAEPTVGLITFAYSLKASLPRKKVRPFVTAGVGIFQADVQLVWDSGSIIPYTESLATDKGLETRFGGGLDFRVRPKTWLGLEFRKIDAEADFGGQRDVDLSGTSIVFAYRREIGKPLGGKGHRRVSP